MLALLAAVVGVARSSHNLAGKYFDAEICLMCVSLAQEMDSDPSSLRRIAVSAFPCLRPATPQHAFADFDVMCVRVLEPSGLNSLGQSAVEQVAGTDSGSMHSNLAALHAAFGFGSPRWHDGLLSPAAGVDEDCEASHYSDGMSAVGFAADKVVADIADDGADTDSVARQETPLYGDNPQPLYPLRTCWQPAEEQARWPQTRHRPRPQPPIPSLVKRLLTACTPAPLSTPDRSAAT